MGETWFYGCARRFMNFPIRIARTKFAMTARTPIATHSMNDIVSPVSKRATVTALTATAPLRVEPRQDKALPPTGGMESLTLKRLPILCRIHIRGAADGRESRETLR